MGSFFLTRAPWRRGGMINRVVPESEELVAAFQRQVFDELGSG
jgi:hypothetical protein